MSRKTGKSSKFAAAVLIIINLITMIISSALFAVSLWIISSPSTMSAAINNHGNQVLKSLLNPSTLSLSLGLAVAALSLFVFFISLMGLYGAVDKSPFLLFMYATLLILLLLLECALMFYFSSTLVEKGLLEQDGQWTHALRLTFKCCEQNITLIPAPSLPWSCCGTQGYPDNCTAFLVYHKNCNQTIPAWISRYQTAVYASLCVVHIVLASCSIIRRSRSASHVHS